MKKISHLSLALLVSALVMLPACDLFKSKKGTCAVNLGGQSGASADGGNVLAYANGQPLMTVDEFEQEYRTFINNHPAGPMIANMPGIERQLLDGFVAQRLIGKYIVDKGINNTQEYQDLLKQKQREVDLIQFAMQNKPDVKESDVDAYYKENKDKMPELIVSRGGVNTVAVSFDSEDAAKEFLQKAKGKGAQLADVAKDAGVAADKIRDFKLVHAQSFGIDPVLREKVLEFKKFPTLELVKAGDKNFWVVYVANKEDAKYRPLDQIREQLKERLMQERQQEALIKAVDKLKGDYNFTINEDYFAKKVAEQQAAMPEEEENMDQVMPAAASAAKPAAQAV